MMDYLLDVRFLIVLYCIFAKAFAENYFVSITSDGPVVLGAKIHFRAELFSDAANKIRPSGEFRYRWRDNGIPTHYSPAIESKNPWSEWSVSYPASEGYKAGPYIVEVDIEKWYGIFYITITSQRYSFNVTDFVNGHLFLEQNKTIREDAYVSSTESLSHSIVLNAADAQLLRENATSVLTYWFIDCVYYGTTDNYSFTYSYKDVEKEHNVEALVIASYEKLPPITTTTTTSTTTTTTTTTTTPRPTTTITTTTPTTTTHKSEQLNKIEPAPDTNTSTSKLKRSANATQESNGTNETRKSSGNSTVAGGNQTTTEMYEAKLFVKENVETAKVSSHTIAISNGTEEKANAKKMYEKFLTPSSNDEFSCLNGSFIAPDPKKTYGYFHRKIIVQAPVNNLTVTGNNWLQHGDMLHLQVSCQGTPPFHYCLMWKPGLYNVTGNETCETEITADLCDFPIVHYFPSPSAYSVVVIISNTVKKLIAPVAVTIYKVNKSAQLSVIVVPVVFSFVAITLVVFGVAYYIQSRARFNIEVADFDFGRSADLEYRTFWNRVVHNVRESWPGLRWWRAGHAHHMGDSSPGSHTSDSSLKYGSMT